MPETPNTSETQPAVPAETQEADASSPYKDRYLTIPNIICMARIIGSVAMVGLAIADYPRAFVIAFVVLSLSDWVDGKLARWLNQRSDFGARLDSASDAVLYTCLLIGSLILKWDVLKQEFLWLLMPLTTYAITIGYGLWKYGRAPSYHTYGAKFSYWLVLFGGVALLLDWSVWPIRMAAVSGTLTNLEATAITYVLPTWQADILTILHVLPKRRAD